MLKKENRKRLKDRLTVEDVEITMEGDSTAPVRQSDRTSKDDPDEMELRPATCVTHEGGHDENQQQSTSHVTPTCLEDAPEASSVNSGDDIISPSPSTYPNTHEPIPLPFGASCDPPTDSLPASLSRQGPDDDTDDDSLVPRMKTWLTGQYAVPSQESSSFIRPTPCPRSQVLRECMLESGNSTVSRQRPIDLPCRQPDDASARSSELAFKTDPDADKKKVSGVTAD